LQILLLSLASFGSMVLAGHFDEDHGGSTYEEKTKTVQIPIIKKYGNFTFLSQNNWDSILPLPR